MSRRNGNELEKPDIEGKLYDPEGYSNLETFRLVAGAVFIVGFLSCGATIVSSDIEDGITSTVTIFIVFFIVMAVTGFMYNVQLEEHKEKVFSKKNEEKEDLHKTAKSNKSLLQNANSKLEQQMKLMESLQKAQSIGDIIISNNHAPVIISSTIRNSFNTLSESDPELASAIKTLGGFIENSGNLEAAAYFNEFHQNIANEERNPTILKALWTGIVSALPTVKELTEVVAKIATLIP